MSPLIFYVFCVAFGTAMGLGKFDAAIALGVFGLFFHGYIDAFRKREEQP